MYHRMRLELDKMSHFDGAYFKAMRLRMGFTQNEFASLLQVDRKTISRTERCGHLVNPRLIFSVLFLHGMFSQMMQERAAIESDARERERQRLMRDREAAESSARAKAKKIELPALSKNALPPSARSNKVRKKKRRR